ncbi:MAG: M67 family metallopeptidase [Nitrospirae bacterium]|nr:M67 family metallopeptidase [Nitrospirota bacterium]
MLSIKREDIEIVLEHARDENPREACGILAGNDGVVEKVYRMKNKDLSSVTYLMDSMEQFAVMKEMKEKGLDLVGIYHSHTSSVAYPSATDIERAFYPEASYLIVSLSNKEPQIRSFRIKDGKVEEEEMRIL